jgi:YVTN family beta-propeller protein
VNAFLALLFLVTALCGVQVGAQTHPIFVLNSADANLSVIDPATWTVKQTIPTGKEPHHLYLSPDEKSVIVANAASDSLTFIDPKTAAIQRTVRGIRDPYHLRFSPDMKWFVTAANRLNHIDIYEWKNNEPVLKTRIPTGKVPSHLWINTKSTVLYATMQDSNELIAIDLAKQTLLWRTKTGKMPADIFGTTDDKTLLVGLTGSDGVEVFDVSAAQPKRVKQIPTGKGAHAFRAAGDKQHVYVSNRIANTISKLDLTSHTIVATYQGGSGADCMEVLVANGQATKLLVTSRWERNLTVIDLVSGKVERKVAVGKSPHGVWTLDHAARH